LALDAGNLLGNGEDLVREKATEMEAIAFGSSKAGAMIQGGIAKKFDALLPKWKKAFAHGKRPARRSRKGYRLGPMSAR
jgi:hypothetical protein